MKWVLHTAASLNTQHLPSMDIANTPFTIVLPSCRNEVLGWLASIGAERQITDKAAKVPQLSEEDWLKLQAKPRKAALKPSAASKPKQPPSKPQQQQQAAQQQRVAATAQPATPKVPPISAVTTSTTGGTPEFTSKKASGRPRKKAKMREPCEYCSKTTHDSEECPIKLAAEEGSEGDISEDDQPHDQPHGQAHAQPCESMDVDTSAAEPAPSSDMEAGNEEEAELAPSAALAPLRHDTIVRRNPGRELSFSPEVQVLQSYIWCFSCVAHSLQCKHSGFKHPCGK